MTIRRLACAIAAGALASACDPASMSSGPAPAACTSVGAQCQLPDGPLGVCEQVPCGPGASPPCLACASQH